MSIDIRIFSRDSLKFKSKRANLNKLIYTVESLD